VTGVQTCALPISDAALQADDGDAVAGQHRGPDQLQLALPLRLLLLAAQLEPRASGRGPAAFRLLPLAVEQPVGGQLDGRRVTERCRARIGGLPLVVLDGLRPGGPDAGVDGRLPRLLFRLVPLRRDPRVLRTALALARALGRLTRSLLGGLCLGGLCLGVRLRGLLVREAVTAGLRRGSRRGTGLRAALGTGLRAALGTRVREA